MLYVTFLPCLFYENFQVILFGVTTVFDSVETRILMVVSVFFQTTNSSDSLPRSGDIHLGSGLNNQTYQNQSRTREREKAKV